MSKLISTTNTEEARAVIERAAERAFCKGAGEHLAFEHGQWWLVFAKCSFSVVDAPNGVDFEQVV